MNRFLSEASHAAQRSRVGHPTGKLGDALNSNSVSLMSERDAPVDMLWMLTRVIIFIHSWHKYIRDLWDFWA